MEQKIKRIEEKLATWKAVKKRTSREKEAAYNYAAGCVDAYELAILILKEPSNTQIQPGVHRCVCPFCDQPHDPKLDQRR